MAVVYLAHDPVVKRPVALKVLPRQFTFDPEFRARFQREAEIIAALEHPAVVSIYDVGEDDEQPYIVMRYMPGGTLADRLRRGPLPLAEAARLVARLAPALDEAHARQIIHRDLKPENILFDQRGDPYLSDFGLAKLAQAGKGLTSSVIIGTPAYISPEQAEGRRQLDGRSDVYALGALLFEMLTGRLPFEADSAVALLLKHLNEPAPRLHAVRPDLPLVCEVIVARALAKSPTDRYPTVGALAHDLSRAAAGENVGAPGVIEPAPSPIATPPLGAPGLSPENAEAMTLLLTLEGHTKPVNGLAFGPEGVMASASEDGTVRLWALPVGKPLRVLKGHREGVWDVAFNPDGRTLASASRDHAARVWEVNTGRLLLGLEGHTAGVRCVAFSPDGRRLVSGSFDATVRVWDAASGQLQNTLTGHTDAVACLAFSPDGRTLVSGSWDDTLRLWDAAKGHWLRTLKGHTGAVVTVAFITLNDELFIASGDRSETARWWDARRGENRRTLTDVFGGTGAVFSPDGRLLAFGNWGDNSIQVWDADSGRPMHVLEGHTDSVTVVAFSPDGRTLASGGKDGTVRLWGIEGW